MVVSPNSGQTGCTTASLFTALALTLGKSRCTGYIRTTKDRAIENMLYLENVENQLEHSFSSMITSVRASTTSSNILRGYTWKIAENCDLLPSPEHSLSDSQIVDDISVLLDNFATSFNDIILDFGTDISSELSLQCQRMVDKVIIVLNQNKTVIQNAYELKEQLINNIDKTTRRKMDLDNHFFYFVNKYNPAISTYKEVAKALTTSANKIISLRYMPSIIKNSNSQGFSRLVSHYWGSTIQDATIKNDILRTCQVLATDVVDWKGR